MLDNPRNVIVSIFFLSLLIAIFVFYVWFHAAKQGDLGLKTENFPVSEDGAPKKSDYPEWLANFSAKPAEGNFPTQMVAGI